MTVPSSPTIRRRRLAAELERLREHARLSREEVAERLDWHVTKVWRLETARSGITPADMRALLDLYAVAGDQREALVVLARHARQKGWWTAYKDVFTDSYFELESESSSIRTLELVLVPGLLQTERYVRALLRASLITADVDRRVAARLERQQIFERDDAPQMWMVVDENALVRPVGGASVMRGQLEHLIEMSQHPKLTFQVIPTSAGAHPGMNGTFTILDFPSEFFAPVVYLETMTDALYLEKDEELARYTLIFDHLRAIALGPDDSVELLRTIRTRLD